MTIGEAIEHVPDVWPAVKLVLALSVVGLLLVGVVVYCLATDEGR